MTAMIPLQKADFDYEPYPIAYLADFIEPDLYRELSASFPDLSLFKFMPKLGDKYALSERFNPKEFREYLARTPVWNRFNQYIKSEAFIKSVLAFLKTKNIDLGLDEAKVVPQYKERSLMARIKRTPELSARFEFSVMKGDGGSIKPHTDLPSKRITISVSMYEPGEWDQAWGGGTQVCLPKDRTRIYNHANRYMGFEEVDILKEFPFVPNQAILFIKTYNSWHEVHPLRGPVGSFRKSLNINIEEHA